MKAKFQFIAALLALFSVTGCNIDHVNISSRIQGKWVLVEADQAAVPTDDSFVITFTSATSARVSMLLDAYEGAGEWIREALFNVDLQGETIHLSGNLAAETSYTAVLQIKSLYDDMMICDCLITEVIDSSPIRQEYTGVFIRDDVDYSQEIIGTWEGDELREDDSGLPDGKKCRFEFLWDGTYNYYRQESDGTWKKSADEFSHYFCDGDVLFMRWRNLGFGKVTNCSSWEYEIRQNMMRWKALRKREDGSTYSVSVDFTKV